MVGGRLKIAVFNVLNFFATDFTGSNARGADTALEFARQRAKIISALIRLDAHILGLVEVQNDGEGPGHS